MSRYVKILRNARRRPVTVVGLCSFGAAAFGLLLVGSLVVDQPAEACNRRVPPPVQCCTATIAVTKAVSATTATPGPGGVFAAVNVIMPSFSGVNPLNPGAPCNPIPTVTPGAGQTITLQLNTFPGGLPAGPPQVFPLNAIGCGQQRTTQLIVYPLPQGFSPGRYTYVATVNATWQSGGGPIANTAVGDAALCVVEESFPGSGIPRGDMFSSAAGPAPQCGAGAQRRIEITVLNNDPVESMSVVLTATSSQQGRMPGNDPGAMSFSEPVEGDDFPICPETDLPAKDQILRRSFQKPPMSPSPF